MVLFHLGFAFALLVLVTSVSLIIWSLRAEPGPGITLAKVVGMIVFILAILDIISMGIGAAMFKSWAHHGKMDNLQCHCPDMKMSAVKNPETVSSNTVNSTPTSTPAPTPNNDPTTNPSVATSVSH